MSNSTHNTQKQPHQKKRKKIIVFLSIVSITTLAVFLWINKQTLMNFAPSSSDNKSNSNTQNNTPREQNKARGNQPLPPVRVVNVIQKDMPNQLTALGTVKAKNEVTITSRVNGELIGIHFTEGQKVKSGDKLFSIDPRAFQIALEQAQGQLLRDLANLDNAKADVNRLNQLKAKSAVSAQELATQNALVKQLEGVVKSSQANVENAKLQLSYTAIYAPIEGMAGLEQLSIGNYVQASSQNLLSITQTDPIETLLSLPERYIPEIQRAFRQGDIMVEAWNSDQSEQLATGKIISFNNQINATTGTLQLKAEFENKNEILFPNQFVNLRVKLNTEKDALVLPISAIQNGTEGQFIWQVTPVKVRDQKESDKENSHNGANTPKNPLPKTPKNSEQDKQTKKEIQTTEINKNKDTNQTTKKLTDTAEQPEKSESQKWQVEKVNVTTGHQFENWIVIKSGVQLGDRVVTDGVDRLTVGSQVQIINE